MELPEAPQWLACIDITFYSTNFTDCTNSSKKCKLSEMSVDGNDDLDLLLQMMNEQEEKGK